MRTYTIGIMHRGLLLLLKKHISFVIPFLIFVLLGALLQLCLGKRELFLVFNAHHSAFFDDFFKLYTWLGDGVAVLLFVLVLAMLKYRYALVTVSSYAYTAVVAQIIKHSFNQPRPIKFFEGSAQIRLLEGYQTHSWNSFPSGHSVSAFALAVCLSYIFPFRKSGLLFFMLFLPALLSRVYLAQHFFQDVYAGGILGAILTFQLISWLEQTKWYHSPKLERGFFGS